MTSTHLVSSGEGDLLSGASRARLFANVGLVFIVRTVHLRIGAH